MNTLEDLLRAGWWLTLDWNKGGFCAILNHVARVDRGEDSIEEEADTLQTAIEKAVAKANAEERLT